MNISGPISYSKLFVELNGENKVVHMFGDVHFPESKCKKEDITLTELVDQTILNHPQKRIDIYTEVGMGKIESVKEEFSQEFIQPRHYIEDFIYHYAQYGCWNHPRRENCQSKFPNAQFHFADYRLSLYLLVEEQMKKVPFDFQSIPLDEIPEQYEKQMINLIRHFILKREKVRSINKGAVALAEALRVNLSGSPFCKNQSVGPLNLSEAPFCKNQSVGAVALAEALKVKGVHTEFDIRRKKSDTEKQFHLYDWIVALLKRRLLRILPFLQIVKDMKITREYHYVLRLLQTPMKNIFSFLTELVLERLPPSETQNELYLTLKQKYPNEFRDGINHKTTYYMFELEKRIDRSIESVKKCLKKGFDYYFNHLLVKLTPEYERFISLSFMEQEKDSFAVVRRVCGIMDLYFIIRICKPEQKNIICYFGDNHVKKIKVFLKFIGANVIEEYKYPIEQNSMHRQDHRHDEKSESGMRLLVHFHPTVVESDKQCVQIPFPGSDPTQLFLSFEKNSQLYEIEELETENIREIQTSYKLGKKNGKSKKNVKSKRKLNKKSKRKSKK
jgi:hypothetical protein